MHTAELGLHSLLFSKLFSVPATLLWLIFAAFPKSSPCADSISLSLNSPRYVSVFSCHQHHWCILLYRLSDEKVSFAETRAFHCLKLSCKTLRNKYNLATNLFDSPLSLSTVPCLFSVFKIFSLDCKQNEFLSGLIFQHAASQQ